MAPLTSSFTSGSAKRHSSMELKELQQWEDARNELAAIVESSDDAIFSKDLNGIVKSWNRGAERVFGYKAHEIIGQSNSLIIPPELEEEEALVFSKIMAGERID